MGAGACLQKTSSSGTASQTISLIQATALLTRAKTSGKSVKKNGNGLVIVVVGIFLS